MYATYKCSRLRRLLNLMVCGMVAVFLVSACAGPPRARRGAGPYYQGRTIEIVIPFKEGGGTDLWARFLALFLEKHIEGHPKVVIRNMPGGEGITGTNWFAAGARKDGTTLLGSSATTMFHSLLGRPEVRYDFTRMHLVTVSATGGVIYASPRAVGSVEALRQPARPLVYGGISATGIDLVVLLAYEVLGLDVKSVLGFEGKGPVRLAFERGETTIDFQTTAAYQSGVAPLVSEGKAVPLMSLGMPAQDLTVTRDPVVPDLATVPEAYARLYGRPPSGPAWDAYLAFLTAGFSYQKALWAPEGTPPEALEALRRGVERMVADPDFAAKGGEVLGGYPTFAGQEVEPALQKALQVPPAARQYVRDLLAQKYNVKE
jgi:tripartite-type tricarboxylate transporter receptor subunit TctC